MNNWLSRCAVLGAFLTLAGCASVGPSTITRDRFDYVTTISDSWKRQTLLNLLKIRYIDAPVFMDVASVISSYSLEGEISLVGQYSPPSMRGDSFGNVGAVGRYADKPTITYQPLSGEKFARSLMGPLPVSGILFLIQSGYPADQVLRVCVNSINGLENSYGAPSNPRAGNPKFHELLAALRESQATGESGFRTKSSKDAQTVTMFIRPSTGKTETAGEKIRELLGVNATDREFTVVPGPFTENGSQIAILTRSVLQVMIDMASYVDVPPTDVAEGRVYKRQRTAEQERLFPPMLAVRQGGARPADAYVAVQYRNQWFWIDDRDQPSKMMLSFLMFVFSLTEGTPSQGAPVVTIPAR